MLHSAGESKARGRPPTARAQVTHASFGVGGRGNTRLNAVPTHYHTFVVIKTRVYTNSRTFFIVQARMIFIMQARMIARKPPRLPQPLTKISFKLPRRPQAMEKNSSMLKLPRRPRALEMMSTRLKLPRRPRALEMSFQGSGIPSTRLKHPRYPSPTTVQREMLLTTSWTRHSQPKKKL